MPVAAAGTSQKLLVMTYNVLAQCYVRSSFFPYCKPSELRWKNRSKNLVGTRALGSRCLQIVFDVSGVMLVWTGSSLRLEPPSLARRHLSAGMKQSDLQGLIGILALIAAVDDCFLCRKLTITASFGLIR